MNDISTLSDKFSWRRMMSVGLMYKSSIRMYLLISAGISLVCYMLVQLAAHLYGGNVLGVYTVLSFILGLALYLGPLAFARRDNHLMAQLPAKPVEKWLFYMLFSLVAVPLVVEGIWYGLGFIFRIAGIGINVTDLMMSRAKIDCNMISSIDRVFVVLISVIQASMLVVTVIYAVLGTSSHRIVKGVLSFLGALVVTGIISGITGFFIALSEISSNPNVIETPEKIIENLLPGFSLMYCLLAIYTVVMMWLCYRRIAKEEVKA